MPILIVLFCLAAVTHTLAQDALILPVGREGVQPMHFELRESGAIRMPDGVLYRGDASLVTPLGRMVLAQSELWFGYAPGTEQIQTVRGRAFVPSPLSEEEVTIDEPVMAEVGYDLGENLGDMGVPLLETRGYLFFRFDAGLTMRIGKAPPEDLEEEEDLSFTISFPAGATSRIVVDPLDPMYYFAGGVTLPNKRRHQNGNGETEGKPNDSENEEEDDDGIVTGSGSSMQGLFRFRPLVTWGIEDKAREFMGQRISTGTFPLFGLPVLVRGHLITNLDPLGTGELAVDPLGIGFGPVVQAGANGRFVFSLDFLKVADLGNIMNLTIPLGRASAAVEIVNDRQLAWISGIADPDLDLGLDLLLSSEGELKAAALASTNDAESRLYLDGKYKLGVSEFGKHVGFDTGNLVRIEGQLSADRSGLFVRGLSEAGLYMGPITAQRNLGVEMAIPANSVDERYVQLSGLMHFVGSGVEGVARLSNAGIGVTGKMTHPGWDMTINGGVASSADTTAFVHGSLSVPEALQPDFRGAIRMAAQQVQTELDNRFTAFESSTKDYEFELSLRGMRTVVPPVTDAVMAEINRQITANINARWPRTRTIFGTVEAPGKSDAIRYANNQAEPYRERLRNLKRQMQAGDNTAVRSALETAIRTVLDDPRIRITYRVPVVGTTITVIDYTYVDARFRSQLNTALAGVRALPAASETKIRAEEAWRRVPKRDILLQTAEAIENNAAAAIPRVEQIGFRFPLGRPEWEYHVVVMQQGRESMVSVRLAPDNIGAIGGAIGRAFADIL